MIYKVYYTMPVTFCIETEAESHEEALAQVSPYDFGNDDIDIINYDNPEIEVFTE